MGMIEMEALTFRKVEKDTEGGRAGKEFLRKQTELNLYPA